MPNPFQYGSVVSGDAFCNRTDELADLRRSCHSGEKLFIYSERRLGKTSLVRAVLEKLPGKEFVTVYVDLWPTESETSFAIATARAISMAVASTPKQVLDAAKRMFRHLVPSVSVGEDGKPTVTFGAVTPRQSEIELEEVLAAPAAIAAQGRHKVVVVFDEIQRILDYESDLAERKLRSVIQHQPGVCYLFLGSRKHLIQQMFLDKSRPLYRSAGHYPLQPIAVQHWRGFIEERFQKSGKSIDPEAIGDICQLTEGHPFYTQLLCHVLWELTEPGTDAHSNRIQAALRIVLDREGHAYTMLWESLTANQRRFLRGLAFESHGVKPFSSEFTRRYGLRSASNAQRAAQALIERDVIDPDNGSFVIVDRFFRLWIREQHLGGASGR